MISITKKSELNIILFSCLTNSNKNNLESLVKKLNDQILKNKVKFPILEFCGKILYQELPEDIHINFLDKIANLHTIGGNVILGIILQLRLEKYFLESLNKANEYIILGNEWYVCDIIGERVLGHALLTFPKKTIPTIKKYSKHPDKWIVRSVGVASHYAIKKGLNKDFVDSVFQILLSLSNTTEFHTKKGIGWGSKTTAKFHPEIIQKYESKIFNNPDTKQWFKAKIQIGLKIKKYRKYE